MKLNTTYPLNQLLDAVSKASENIFTLVEEMKKEHTTSRAFISFSTEGMLTTSPYARVTLTRQTSPDRWEGYMEETVHQDGPKTPCAVVRHYNTVVANEDYSNITLCIDFNK